jgi:hypothetical protein
MEAGVKPSVERNSVVALRSLVSPEREIVDISAIAWSRSS